MKQFLPAFRRALWRTSAFTALVIVLSMLGMTFFLITQLRVTWQSQLERRLVAHMQAIAAEPALLAALSPSPSSQDTAPTPSADVRSVETILRTLSLALGGPVLLTDAGGRVWAASHGTPAPGSDLSRMPEIRSARTYGASFNLRADGNDETLTYFVAAPIRGNGDAPLGVVRAALPQARLIADFRPLQLLVIAGALAATLVMVTLAVFLAERDAASLRRITDYARGLAVGRLDSGRLLSIHRSVPGELAQALNRTSDRLRSQTKKRAREKDRLITIMHVMTDGVIILNKSGRVRLLNPAAERILHTTQERAVGRSFVQTARDHRIVEVWERCLANDEDVIATVELGASQYVRVAITPFLKRTARGYLVILQDLTEVRQLQTVRQDFVSNVSHELRTPLASLRALVETLRDGAMEDPPAAQRFLDRMEVEVEALTQMVGELLELSRIESGQISLNLQRHQPAHVLGVGAERLRPQTERANIGLTVDIPTDLPEILVDSGRIQQVVTNLVHNAVKFTPPRGQITVSATIQSGEPYAAHVASGAHNGVAEEVQRQTSRRTLVVVKIQDTGMGIAENELPRIFERFYKTDRSRALGGTGLGLAISKHIIQAHGGEMWAESDGRTGSSFYFYLPVAVRPNPDQPRSLADQPVLAPPATPAPASPGPSLPSIVTNGPSAK